MNKLKSKFRAWLIELVREAVRREQHANAAEQAARAPEKPVRRLKPAPSDPIQIVPSFEQMQADAIEAQEKFYAPESK